MSDNLSISEYADVLTNLGMGWQIPDDEGQPDADPCFYFEDTHGIRCSISFSSNRNGPFTEPDAPLEFHSPALLISRSERYGDVLCEFRPLEVEVACELLGYCVEDVIDRHERGFMQARYSRALSKAS